MVYTSLRPFRIDVYDLQDHFKKTLKVAGIEEKGVQQDTKMVIKDDGTQELSFSIPMRITKDNTIIDNPLWTNTKDGTLLINFRKIKVIFQDDENNEQPQYRSDNVFEFVINKITESHQDGILMCSVSCEGLAFQEQGKTGFKLSLNQDSYDNDWQEVDEYNASHTDTELKAYPAATVNYWMDQVIKNTYWNYKIQMNYNEINSDFILDPEKVYEESFVSSWIEDGNGTLVPQVYEKAKEKERIIDCTNSNRYNITQKIAEVFEIKCRYEYEYDDSCHIIGRTIIFYNSQQDESIGVFDQTYPYNSVNISREIDSADTVTKLFVENIEDNEFGLMSISDVSANKTREDYIQNFDYMLESGNITQDQYLEAQNFENEVGKLNLKISEYQTEQGLLENAANTLRAHAITAVSKVQSATDEVNRLQDEIEAQNNEGTRIRIGYTSQEEFTEEWPPADDALVLEDGKVTITFGTVGIDDSTLVYQAVHMTNSEYDEDASDEYNVGDIWEEYNENIKQAEKIEEYDLNKGISRTTYTVMGLTSADYFEIRGRLGIQCRYIASLPLYQEPLRQKWENIKDKNLDEANTYKQNLANNLEQQTALKENIEEQLNKKNELIEDFERNLGPAIREGSWKDESYKDSGKTNTKNVNLLENFVYIPNLLTTEQDTEENSFGDIEAKTYQEYGAERAKQYYPFINLEATITATDGTSKTLLNLLRDNDAMDSWSLTWGDYWKNITYDEAVSFKGGTEKEQQRNRVAQVKAQSKTFNINNTYKVGDIVSFTNTTTGVIEYYERKQLDHEDQEALPGAEDSAWVPINVSSQNNNPTQIIKDTYYDCHNISNYATSYNKCYGEAFNLNANVTKIYRAVKNGNVNNGDDISLFKAGERIYSAIFTGTSSNNTAPIFIDANMSTIRKRLHNQASQEDYWNNTVVDKKGCRTVDDYYSLAKNTAKGSRDADQKKVIDQYENKRLRVNDYFRDITYSNKRQSGKKAVRKRSCYGIFKIQNFEYRSIKGGGTPYASYSTYNTVYGETVGSHSAGTIKTPAADDNKGTDALYQIYGGTNEDLYPDDVNKTGKTAKTAGQDSWKGDKYYCRVLAIQIPYTENATPQNYAPAIFKMPVGNSFYDFSGDETTFELYKDFTGENSMPSGWKQVDVCSGSLVSGEKLVSPSFYNFGDPEKTELNTEYWEDTKNIIEVTEDEWEDWDKNEANVIYYKANESSDFSQYMLGEIPETESPPNPEQWTYINDERMKQLYQEFSENGASKEKIQKQFTDGIVWEKTTEYNPGDVVSQNGQKYYRCTFINTDKKPDFYCVPKSYGIHSTMEYAWATINEEQKPIAIVTDENQLSLLYSENNDSEQEQNSSLEFPNEVQEMDNIRIKTYTVHQEEEAEDLGQSEEDQQIFYIYTTKEEELGLQDSAIAIYDKPYGSQNERHQLIRMCGNINIEDSPIVELFYPRIGIYTNYLDTATNKLILRIQDSNGENIELIPFEEWYLNQRINTLDMGTYSGYCNYITIKPQVWLKYLNNDRSSYASIVFSISNAIEHIYMDALTASKETAFPQVGYTIDVSTVSADQVKTLYRRLGYVCNINDYEQKLKNCRGAISEIEQNLDKPWEDHITIKNYKTKFEDLFSSIVAATETVKTNATAYERAAAAFYGNGELKTEILQQTVKDSRIDYNFGNGNLTITDNDGIIANSDAGIVVINGGGIYTATQKDGDGEWVYNTGITPKGINANLITTGQQDTNLINIYNGNNLAFKWGKDGIIGYRPEGDSQQYNEDEYVLHDGNGIFLVNKNVVINGASPVDINRVSISWDGLSLKNLYNEEVFSVDELGNVVIQNADIRNCYIADSVNSDGKIFSIELRKNDPQKHVAYFYVYSRYEVEKITISEIKQDNVAATSQDNIKSEINRNAIIIDYSGLSTFETHQFISFKAEVTRNGVTNAVQTVAFNIHNNVYDISIGYGANDTGTRGKYVEGQTMEQVATPFLHGEPQTLNSHYTIHWYDVANPDTIQTSNVNNTTITNSTTSSALKITNQTNAQIDKTYAAKYVYQS